MKKLILMVAFLMIASCGYAGEISCDGFGGYVLNKCVTQDKKHRTAVGYGSDIILYKNEENTLLPNRWTIESRNDWQNGESSYFIVSQSDFSGHINKAFKGVGNFFKGLFGKGE